MTIFTGMNTTASALTAQRLRMDVISSNMANVDTTRGKMVERRVAALSTQVCRDGKPKEDQFSSFLNQAMRQGGYPLEWVKVSRIEEDNQTPFKMVV